MASEDCSILPDVELFESLFSKFNDYYFENELVKPVITISPDRHRGRILGYCTCQKVWTENKKYSQKEIENMTMEEFEAYMDEGSYELTLVAAPAEVNALVISGQVDIAAVPINVGSVLYNKTEGGVRAL